MANTLTFTSPFFILFRGDVFSTLCAAVQPGMSGSEALIELQSVDTSGKTLGQLWQYGSDQRIYQYPASSSSFCIGLNGNASQENQLWLVAPDSSNLSQQWQIVTELPGAPAAPLILNMSNYPQYCMNDSGGNGNAKDPVIIYPVGDPNHLPNNVEWSFAIYPNIPGQLAA